MGKLAVRIELESQQLKFATRGKVLVAFLEFRQRGQEEGIALQGCSPSLALQGSAEPGAWLVEAPASLAPPPVKRLASRCARKERSQVKVSTVPALKGWQRIERPNTMRQRAHSPACSSKQA